MGEKRTIEAKTKLGDVYKLGNHILVCGDSRDIKILNKLKSLEICKLSLSNKRFDINENINKLNIKYLSKHLKIFVILKSKCLYFNNMVEIISDIVEFKVVAMHKPMKP